jgi:hypothetical protein
MSRFVLLCLLVLVGGCAVRGPRCEAHLRPINVAGSPLVVAPGGEHP